MEVAFVIQCNSKITVFKEVKETRLLLLYDYYPFRYHNDTVNYRSMVSRCIHLYCITHCNNRYSTK